MPDAVDLDVVGVAVAAVPVVEHDDVGGLLARTAASRSAASSTSARQNEPGSSFCGQPVIPESR